MIEAFAVAVTGDLDPGTSDYFSFDAGAGQRVTIELLSKTLDVRLDEFDAEIVALDPLGIALPYYSSTAINDDGLEGPDPSLIDLILPASGPVIIEVKGSSSPMLPRGTDGGYELVISTIVIVPEPASVVVFGHGLAGAAGFSIKIKAA